MAEEIHREIAVKKRKGKNKKTKCMYITCTMKGIHIPLLHLVKFVAFSMTVCLTLETLAL